MESVSSVVLLAAKWIIVIVWTALEVAKAATRIISKLVVLLLLGLPTESRISKWVRALLGLLSAKITKVNKPVFEHIWFLLRWSRLEWSEAALVWSSNWLERLILLWILRLTWKGWLLCLLEALHRIAHSSWHTTHGLLKLLELIHPTLHLHTWLLDSHTTKLVILHLHRVKLLLLLWHGHHWVWHEWLVLLLLRWSTESCWLCRLSTHLDAIKSSELVVGRMWVCLIHLVKILNVYRLLGHIVSLLLTRLSANSGLWRLEVVEPIILIICGGWGCWEDIVEIILIWILLRRWRSIKVKKIDLWPRVLLRLSYWRLDKLFTLSIFRNRWCAKTCRLLLWRFNRLIIIAWIEISPLFVLLVWNWLLILFVHKVVFVILQVFLVLLWLIFIQPCWIMWPILIISPLFMNILIREELCNFMVTRVSIWLSEWFWQILLPIRVDHVIAQILEKFDLSLWPFVKVNGFNLGNVHSKLSVNAWAPNAHKTSESNRGPSWDFAIAIYTVPVVGSLEKLFENFGLLVDVHLIFSKCKF